MPHRLHHHLDRLLEAMTYAAMLWCGVILTILYWPLAVLVIVVMLRKEFRRKPTTVTTLGSARWSTLEEVRQAGMLGASTGLVLGRLASPESTRSRGRSVGPDEWVRLAHATHVSIFAPTGAGKSVSLAIPFLLTCGESAAITDLKGELFLKTAAHRRRAFGHRVVVLDPYGVVTTKGDVLNPLDFILRDSRHAIDDINDLAAALVVRPPEEREPHWSDMAESVIAAVSGVVVAYGDAAAGSRSLHAVRDILSNPRRLAMATQLMTESDCFSGMLRPMGGALLNLAEKERASVISSALRHLRFLGTPAVAAVTGGMGSPASTFDPSLLRTTPMSVYLVLPPDRATAQAGLLRMFISTLMRANVRGGIR
jgi:type IV secretion system protein VirD4